ncbi:MAG: hypothetical protein AAB414_03600 [Patescibacteria group bacterium]
MKLTKKLTTKQFVISQVAIFIISLIFLGGLYYILNVQYSQPKNRFAQGPVTIPPKTLRIDLDQPEEDTLVFDGEIIISGKTGPNLEVLIITDSEDLVVKSKPDGKFSTILKLDEGPNKITTAVFDAAGDSRSVERNVYYSKEKI